ncbi:hypothetical protein [Microbacterium luticocti]|uniref:hypothetical protein n=1 Tax=Microbacterium luticocti TaxID=451764 RepID=UPI0012EC1A47|nr:hypothetical protein [Microbacterium luticocti]
MTAPVPAAALDRARDALEQAQADPHGDLVATGPARPTQVASDAGVQTMIVRDQLDMHVPAGVITLTLYCSGEGTVTGTLEVDDDARVGNELICGADGASSDDITMKRAQTGREMTIRVVPVGDTKAAVSYIVTVH